jgi:2-polyprenyl-3-methyl-5-hydroxy-6-metoxy-1,4-benzoquinol methylase
MLNKCPICFEISKKYRSIDNIIIFKCLNCKTLFTDRSIELNKVYELYTNNIYYTEYTNDNISYENVFNKIMDYCDMPKKKCVLEIGPGKGHLIKRLKNEFMETWALEIDSKMKNYLKKNGADKILIDKVENADLPENKFDIIVMHQLIEHLFNPRILLKKVSYWLKHNGIVFLTTVNSDCYRIKYINDGIGLLNPFFHLVIYSKKSLKLLFSKYNYSIINIETEGIGKQLMMKYFCDKPTQPWFLNIENKLFWKWFYKYTLFANKGWELIGIFKNNKER